MGKITINENLKSSSFISNTVSTDDRLNNDFKRTIKISYNFLSELGKYFPETITIDYSTNEDTLKSAFKKSLEGIMKRGDDNNYGEFGFSNNLPYIKRKNSNFEKLISFTNDYKIYTNSSLKFNYYLTTGLEEEKPYGILIDTIDDEKKLNGYFNRITLYEDDNTVLIDESSLTNLIPSLEINDIHHTSIEIASSYVRFKNINSSTNISNIIEIDTNDIVASQKNNLTTTKRYSLFKAIDYYFPGYIVDGEKETTDNPNIILTKKINGMVSNIKIGIKNFDGVAKHRYNPSSGSGDLVDSFINQTYNGTSIGLHYDAGDPSEPDRYYSLDVNHNEIKFHDIENNISLVKVFCSFKLEGTNVTTSNDKRISKIEIWINGVTTYAIAVSNDLNVDKFKSTFKSGVAYEATGYITRYYNVSLDPIYHIISPGFISNIEYDSSKVIVYAMQNSSNAIFEIPWSALSVSNFTYKVH